MTSHSHPSWASYMGPSVILYLLHAPTQEMDPLLEIHISLEIFPHC